MISFIVINDVRISYNNNIMSIIYLCYPNDGKKVEYLSLLKPNAYDWWDLYFLGFCVSLAPDILTIL
jgi:hypothetical protein